MLAQLLRKLSRDAQLSMRLLSQLFCTRITTALSDDRLRRLVRFERMFRMPVALTSLSDEAQFVFALCRRFGVDNRNWVLRINLPGFLPFLAYGQQSVALAAQFGGCFAIELLISGAYFGDGWHSGDSIAPPLVLVLEPLLSHVTALSINNCADGLPLLLRLPALQTLDMSCSSLGSPGTAQAQALAPALATLSSLTSLSLAFNDHGNDAAYVKKAPFVTDMEQQARAYGGKMYPHWAERRNRPLAPLALVRPSLPAPTLSCFAAIGKPEIISLGTSFPPEQYRHS